MCVVNGSELTSWTQQQTKEQTSAGAPWGSGAGDGCVPSEMLEDMDEDRTQQKSRSNETCRGFLCSFSLVFAFSSPFACWVTSAIVFLSKFDRCLEFNSFSSSTMFEATLPQGTILKRLIDAMKDIVSDANLDCAETGISLQAMDASHVSLVAVLLQPDLFSHYRCDSSKSLGVNFTSLSKIMKCASNDDKISIQADDDNEEVSFVFESQDKITDFDMKLLTIDAEHLGIPDTEYMATITMPSAEFMRICRDLAIIGETCTISAAKEGVRFSVQGDLGSGNITLRETSTSDAKQEEKVFIKIDSALELTFALTYLNMFTKATPLSPTVTLKMAPEVPLVVEYPIDNGGHIRYYLAPKIDEDE